MSGPVIRTKLYAPKVRRALVPRPRLGQRPDARLTLVSAPPGFGKTTLLASWLELAATAGRPVAWLSLEETERSPETFWTYVVTALDGAAPGAGARALPLLQAPHPVIDGVLATLVNDLSALPTGIDLVLDDYHLADSPAIAGDVAFLVEHLPEQVHVVISTRADPALPLARWRARGELAEVRAADLRFTPDEVTTYLNEVSGLDLAASDIAALEGRTEGWIAALQLAALSLQGRDDAARFIAGFAGDDRYVVDYLVEEVLTRQPDDVRRFLLDTSVLDRLSGPLCDAVTRRDDGRAVLERLDRANLFVVPLDDSRHWYRYHHLFADVLRTHLLAERPDEVAGLHGRAGDWYDAAGEPDVAVRHALAAGDVAAAADRVERAILGLLRERREATARGWLDDIPDEVVAARPVLAVGFIGALMSRGEFADVARRLDEVERVLADPAAETVVVDQAELTRLPGAIAMYRAALALIHGDPVATVEHADRAVSLAVDGDDVVLSAASALSGLASWGAGDLAGAHRRYSTAVEGLLRAGHIGDVLGCTITLADIRITQGRLDDARRTYQDALELAAREPGPVLRGTADMLVGLSQVALDRNDLAEAEEHLSRAEGLGDALGLPQFPYRRRVARAQLLEAEGDLAGAVALLEDAERVYVGDFSPDVRPVPAMRARVLVKQGRADEALAWARERGLSADDEPTYVREYEHVTLARILLAQGDPRAADALLARLQGAAEEGGRAGTVAEILELRRIPTTTRQGLVDPLSPRELDVLRLLASDLAGPDIARQLVVSVNTVRTHTKSIYAKLGVTSRRAAVTRARRAEDHQMM